MASAKPQALIFDVFGTLVDWREGVATVAARWFTAKGISLDPLEFADAWRGEYQPAMSRIRSGERGYVPLDDLHRENLDAILSRLRLDDRFDETERQELNHAWEQLPCWPDVAAGMDLLRNDFLLAPCSNGSIALMARLARFAGLRWDAILGADIARAYKPRPETYRAACAALRLAPGSVVMVAAHNDDLHAARACGLRTAFIPRPTEYGPDQTTDLAPDDQWDFIASDLPDLHSRLAR